MKATTVDQYLLDGCGRCSKGGTPNCTVHKWHPILVAMRELATECMLTEEVKWSVPCYTLKGKNVLMVHAFMEYCSIMFMKGSLLTDPENILHRQTENVTAGRQLRYTRIEDFLAQRERAKAFILEAIKLEEAGKKVEKRTQEEPVVDELKEAFAQDSAFETAFYQLTPGRQRAYLLHFAQPKQAATRASRIEKCMPMILRGEGLHDAYQKGKK
ncbi:MAG: YdeI/OmpD-associated family protein [Flavobacteriales bacterium]|jgi:uncharacterized protein YdeI (YjbR/CyaY-like superfamily)